ncbi:integrin alpha-D-like [Ciona intestinalis]
MKKYAKKLYTAVLLTVVALGTCNCFNLRNFNLIESSKGGFQNGTYFGQTVVLKASANGTIKLLIGAPNSRRNNFGSSQGTLYGINFTVASGIYNILAEDPEKHAPIVVTNLRKDADAIGISVSNSEESVTVCAPMRYRHCRSHNIVSGSCFKSKDFGESWQSAKPTVPFCSDQALDLLFVLDGSFSVGKTNFGLVKNWVVALAKSFDIEKQDNIGIIQYSHWYPGVPYSQQPFMKTEVPLGLYKNFTLFENIAQNISLQGFTTYTAHALNKTVLDFMASERFTHENVTKVMILITDGRADDAIDLYSSAEYVRSQGIITFAIGIGNSVLRDQLQIVANGKLGEDTRVFEVTTFASLNTILSLLRSSITQSLEGGDGLSQLEYGENGFSSNQQADMTWLLHSYKVTSWRAINSFSVLS